MTAQPPTCEDFCERCETPIPGKGAWLEMSFQNKFARPPRGKGPHGDGTVFGPQSQGAFAFGAVCARIVLRTPGWEPGMSKADEKAARGES
jgi:hypothetical protein